MSNYNNKIKHTCGEIGQAICISYETPLPIFSQIGDCADLDATTTELYTLVGSIQTQTDLSELGEQCLTYVLDENKIIVKNVLLKMESEICTLKNKVSILETTSICDTDIQSCALNFNGLVDECLQTPTTLKEVLQLILNNLTTPV